MKKIIEFPKDENKRKSYIAYKQAREILAKREKMTIKKLLSVKGKEV